MTRKSGQPGIRPLPSAAHPREGEHRPRTNTRPAALVEKNAPQIAKAAQLAADYRVHVRRVLKDKLDETLRDHAIGVVDEGWAYRCTSARWRENDMVLIYDAATGLYSVRTYLDGQDHALTAAA